jgi:hypothetical protein
VPTTGTAPASGEQRDFMFQINGLRTPNQHGQTLNLFVHYRYDAGLAETAIPNYLDLRTVAVDYLTKSDFSKNPYWETLTKTLCGQLKQKFPVSAISCELQLAGVDTPGPRYEPGWHASVDTIGDITPLAIAGPTDMPIPHP